jgi:hypothetical protein
MERWFGSSGDYARPLRRQLQPTKPSCKSIHPRTGVQRLSNIMRWLSSLLWRRVNPDNRNKRALSGLHLLPSELLLVVRDHMEPADAVCLALTCKDLFRLINYQLAVIYNVRRATGLGTPFRGHLSEAILHQQTFSATGRLDRDRLNYMSSTEDESLFSCSTCFTFHRFYLFSESQRTNEPSQRICLAAEPRLRLCDHWELSFQELRRRRRASICESTPKPNYRCKHDSHWTNGNLAISPEVRLENSRVTWVHHIMEYTGQWPGTTPQIEDLAIQYFNAHPGARRICAHITLGDEELRTGLNDQSTASYFRQECLGCGTRWYFDRLAGWGPLGTSTMGLEVSKYFREMEDPWDDQWVRTISSQLACFLSCVIIPLTQLRFDYRKSQTNPCRSSLLPLHP